jgi:hypothetical protein
MTADIVFQNDSPEGSREDVLGRQTAVHMHNWYGQTKLSEIRSHNSGKPLYTYKSNSYTNLLTTT